MYHIIGSFQLLIDFLDILVYETLLYMYSLGLLPHHASTCTCKTGFNVNNIYYLSFEFAIIDWFYYQVFMKLSLFQIFHKSDAVERMMNGDIPNVRCTGELREFIMNIRTQPLEVCYRMMFYMAINKINTNKTVINIIWLFKRRFWCPLLYGWYSTNQTQSNTRADPN